MQPLCSVVARLVRVSTVTPPREGELRRRVVTRRTQYVAVSLARATADLKCSRLAAKFIPWYNRRWIKMDIGGIGQWFQTL